MVRFIIVTCILTWIRWIYKLGKMVYNFFSGHDLRQALEDYKVEQAIAEVEAADPTLKRRK